MADYRLVTDVTCDMRADILEDHHIEVIPMEVMFDDGRTFFHYPDFRNFSEKDFYQELVDGHTTHTGQITPAKYLEVFEPILKNGEDILYCCFSSALSNTYQSSLVAVESLKDKYPERTIISVDSRCASGGEGVLALTMAANKEAGMTIEENAEWLEENQLRLAHYFTVETLTYLKRGGRVSAATALVANTLNIKPVLYVDDNGALETACTVHGRKASMKRLVQMTLDTIEHPEEQVLYIGETSCMEDAELLKEMVLREIPCKGVEISPIGLVVGTHTGPGTLTLFSYGRKRLPEKDEKKN